MKTHPVTPIKRSLTLVTIMICVAALAVVYVSRSSAQDPKETPAKTRAEQLYGPFDYATFLEREKNGEFPSQAGPVPLVSPYNSLANNDAGSSGSSQFTQSETTLTAFGNTVVVGFNDSGSIAGGSNKFTGWARSVDGGATFTDGGTLPTNPNGDAGDPVFARNETTGRIFFATLQFSGSGINIFHSDDNGVTWSLPVQGAPGKTGFQDKEWIAVDNFAGPGNGNLYHVARDFGGGDGIYFFRSTDQGASFGPNAGTLIVAGSQGAFVTVGPDHAVYVFWHDGFTDRINVRKSTDQGLTFGPTVNVASGLVGGSNGDLSLTGVRQGTASASGFRSNEFPHAAINPISGNIYVTFDNDGPGADKADVFLTQSTDGGATWSAPTKVNDDVTTTDQWQPTLAVTPDGLNLGIFYYSRQEDPTGNNLFKFYGRNATISGGTITFAQSYAISDVASLPEFGRDSVVNTTYMGDYDHAVATSGAFHVVWADNRDDLAGGAGRKNPNVYYKRIDLGLHVTDTNPVVASVLTTPPTVFTINVSEPINPGTLQASDLTVNGIPATSFTYTPGSTTIQFTFAATPVTAQGLQTMSVAAGAFASSANGDPVYSFSGPFRYDTLLLQVVSTVPPTGGGVFVLPGPNTYDVNFNEPIDPASVQTTDLLLSGIAGSTVTGVTVLPGNTTARFTVSFPSEGPATATLASGSVTDVFGNFGSAFTGTYLVDIGTQPYPTPLTAKAPFGSLIYDPTASGNIGFAGDSDSFTLNLDPGQAITAIVTGAPALQSRVDLLDPGSLTIATATAPAAGAVAVIQSAPVSTAGIYRFVVSGSAGTTGNYTLQVILNASRELEGLVTGVTNNTLATAQGMNESFINLTSSLTSAQRGAVNGVSDLANYTATAVASSFEDISGTGTVIAGLTNQDEASVSIPIGLTFPFYGSTYTNVFVSSNGLLTFGTAFASFSNSDLTSSPQQAAIAPFWDDQHTNGGVAASNVFYQVTGAGSDQHLTIQWNQVRFFSGVALDNITYEVQLFVDGRIKFNYLDLVSGTAFGNNGRLATVGVKDTGTQGVDRLLLCFNNGPNAFVGTGLSTLLSPPNPTADYYSLTLTGGESTTLVVESLGFDPVAVELLNSGGAVVATGVAGATNVDRAINNFVVPSSGTYYARVTSGGSVPYDLVVTRNADFDTEANDTRATAQSLNGVKGVLGSIQPNTALQASAVAFAFEDISGTGTIIPGLTNQDDSSVSIPVGFGFPLYAAIHTSVFVSSNGLLTFGTANTAFTNGDLTTNPAQAAIAPFWDDLHTHVGNVYYQVSGAGPDQHLTIQWNQIGFRLETPGDTLTFQVQLYSDGRIRINYQDLVAATSAGNNGGSATVGLKDAGDQGANRLLLALNNGPNTFVGTGLSTLITPSPSDDWYSVTVGASPVQIRLQTSTPADGPGEFVNLLNPHIELYDSSNVLVASGSPVADGRNELITISGLSAGNYAVKVSSEGGTRGEYFLGVIGCTSPVITTTSIPAGSTGIPYNQQITVSPVGPAYSFVIAAGSLPSGFTLNPSTGVISGTLADPFSTNFTVRVTGPSGCYSEQAYTLNIVCSALIVNPATLPGGAAGIPYNQTLSASPAASLFEVTAGALPPGITLNPATGALTGSPTTIGTFSFTIRATASNGCTGSRGYTLVISCPAITLSPAALPSALVNTNYSQSITASPGGGSYSFAVTNGALPPGLTLSPTGDLTGAPLQSGFFNFRVTATRFGTCTGFRDYQLSVACPVVTLNPTSLPGAALGAPYSQSVIASPAGTYSYTVSSGTLPNGLTLNSSTGALTGTASVPGSFTFTISATAGTCVGNRTYTVVVTCIPAITTTSLPPGTSGSNYSQLIGVSPAGSYTFSLVQGNLPSGMTLNPSTGLISGIPGAPGTANFIVKAQTPNGCSATQSLSLTITCPTVVVTPPTLAGGQIGTPYNQAIVASPASTYTFSVTGALPPGLALNAQTGLLSGTPTANGTFSFTVNATRAFGCTGSRVYSITIAPGACPTITLPTLTGGVVGKLYQKYVTASPAGTYAYSLTGTAPPGVTFYGATGLLFGYPSTAGNYNFSVTATDVNGCTAVRNYAVAITP